MPQDRVVRPRWRDHHGKEGVWTLVAGATHRERHPSQTETAATEQNVAEKEIVPSASSKEKSQSQEHRERKRQDDVL